MQLNTKFNLRDKVIYIAPCGVIRQGEVISATVNSGGGGWKPCTTYRIHYDAYKELETIDEESVFRSKYDLIAYIENKL